MLLDASPNRIRRWQIRSISVTAFAGGGGIATALLAYYGFHTVLALAFAVGWRRLLATSVIQRYLAVAGIAWWLLFLRSTRSPWPFVSARLIREAGSELLPFSALGGYIMSARALAVQGVSGPRCIASLIVDVTLEIAAQIVFAIVALGLLAWFDRHSSIIGPVAVGPIVACGATALGYTIQRRNIGSIGHIAVPIVGNLLNSGFEQTDAVQRSVNAIYRDRWRAPAGFLLHLAVGSRAPLRFGWRSNS